jgi:hypothetical protein
MAQVRLPRPADQLPSALPGEPNRSRLTAEANDNWSPVHAVATAIALIKSRCDTRRFRLTLAGCPCRGQKLTGRLTHEMSLDRHGGGCRPSDFCTSSGATRSLYRATQRKHTRSASYFDTKPDESDACRREGDIRQGHGHGRSNKRPSPAPCCPLDEESVRRRFRGTAEPRRSRPIPEQQPKLDEPDARRRESDVGEYNSVSTA